MPKEKEETVEVTVKLPKAIVDFLKDHEGNVEEYITHAIIELQVSSIELMKCKGEIEDAEQFMEQRGLKQVFKQHDVLPSYYER